MLGTDSHEGGEAKTLISLPHTPAPTNPGSGYANKSVSRRLKWALLTPSERTGITSVPLHTFVSMCYLCPQVHHMHNEGRDPLLNTLLQTDKWRHEDHTARLPEVNPGSPNNPGDLLFLLHLSRGMAVIVPSTPTSFNKSINIFQLIFLNLPF